jgi:hypothetical protein
MHGLLFFLNFERICVRCELDYIQAGGRAWTTSTRRAVFALVRFRLTEEASDA